jgi:hypothetical protein
MADGMVDGRPIWPYHRPSAISPQPWLSAFQLQRMLTKLYGGQGPVYLNVSLSKRLAIDFTLPSNAVS